jgi:hypothetical protein
MVRVWGDRKSIGEFRRLGGRVDALDMSVRRCRERARERERKREGRRERVRVCV